jgi:hypothetical protein
VAQTFYGIGGPSAQFARSAKSQIGRLEFAVPNEKGIRYGGRTRHAAIVAQARLTRDNDRA